MSINWQIQMEDSATNSSLFDGFRRGIDDDGEHCRKHGRRRRVGLVIRSPLDNHSLVWTSSPHP